jgi:hypothetical protein
MFLPSWGNKAVHVLIVEDAEADLPEKVHALRPPRRLAGRAYGGHGNRDQ